MESWLKMRILLVGEYRCNMGPANVNKKIIEHMPGEFSYIKFRWTGGLGKVLNLLELMIKLLISQVVIVSVTSRIGYIAGKMCAFFKKKLVFIMHGCAAYEAEINTISGSRKGEKIEHYLMEQAAVILPVSPKYGTWLRNRYAEYKDRIGVWSLGYDPVERVESGEKRRGVIMTAGGNTPQKNNNQVSDAVALLAGAARLEIYGKVNPAWVQKNNEYTCWMGSVPNDVFLKRLSEADIFIVNSTLESFSIALMESLHCGCNILVSSGVGALDLLEVEPTDIIEDVNDVGELQTKIQYLMNHPNHDRICAKLDWNEISNANAMKRLREICEETLCARQGK